MNVIVNVYVCPSRGGKAIHPTDISVWTKWRPVIVTLRANAVSIAMNHVGRAKNETFRPKRTKPLENTWKHTDEPYRCIMAGFSLLAKSRLT